MFSFLQDMDNYEDRKVANDEVGGAIIDTCAISDSDRPYETGIAHAEYNDGKWIIVELYDTKEDAVAGHSKWVKAFSGKRLPAQLADVNECGLQHFAKAIGTDLHAGYERKCVMGK